MKKILSMLLVVMFVFSCVTFTAGAEGTGSTGSYSLNNIEYNPQYFEEHQSKINNIPNVLSAQVVPFIVGKAVKISPKEAEIGNQVCPEITVDYVDADKALKDRPYVRLEYYMHVGESGIAGMYPEIKIITEENSSGYKLTFPIPLADGWNVANIDIAEKLDGFAAKKDEKITSIVFYPYGTNVEGYNNYIFEYNKFYLTNLIFSQDEITAGLEYPVPEIDGATGEFLAYTYVPGDGLPVVYYARGGTHTGKAAESTDQTRAYGTLSEAIKAVDAVGGGYVILCDDILIKTSEPENVILDSAKSIPSTTITSHSNMVILRGKGEGANKTSVYIAGNIKTNGPLWLQNINFASAQVGSKGVASIYSGNTKFNYGTPGAGEDDITYNIGGSSSLLPSVVGGYDYKNAIGGAVNGNVDMNFYSGTYGKALETAGTYNGIQVSGNVNIGLHGTRIKGQLLFGGAGADAWVGGDYNLTITGGIIEGKLVYSIPPSRYTSKVDGDFNIKITGGDFSTMSAGSIVGLLGTGSNPDCVVGGEKTIDILDYVGDVTELLPKINLDSFDIKKVDMVYVSTTQGDDDAGTGTEGSPYATISRAIESMNGQGGRILLLDEYTVPVDGEVLSAHTGTINLSTGSSGKLILEGTLTLGGSMNFVATEIESTDAGKIVAGKNKLEIGKNVNVSGNPDINGVNVTVNSGTFGDIIGGVTENGGTQNESVEITINDGTINGDIVGGSVAEDATINGNVNITITGGNIKGDVIVGSRKASSKVTNLAGITITGGTFTGNMITAGNGTIGDKSSIDYSEYDGNLNLESIIDAESFDIVIKPKTSKPVISGSNNIQFVILDIIGDPTKALTPGLGGGNTGAPTNPDIEVGLDKLLTVVENSGAFTASVTEHDGKMVAEYVPDVSVGKEFSIEAFNTVGKPVNTLEYRYVTVQLKLKTNGTEPLYKPAIAILPGNAPSNAYKRKTFYAEEPLVPNKWTNVSFYIKPEDETAYMTRQFHLMPVGAATVGSELMPGDRVYISRVVFSSNPVNLSLPRTNGKDSEVVLNANDPVVLNPNSLLKSRSANSFRAAVAEFDGKTVSRIKPLISNAPIEIDASAVFKDTGATPSGALDVNNHKYVVINYYYETTKASNDYAYEFELTGNRIWSVGNVLNAKKISGAPLETNKWTTLVIDLSEFDGGNRTSGFIFRPFADEAASKLRGDKLYIESVTFTTIKPD